MVEAGAGVGQVEHLSRGGVGARPLEVSRLSDHGLRALFAAVLEELDQRALAVEIPYAWLEAVVLSSTRDHPALLLHALMQDEDLWRIARCEKGWRSAAKRRGITA